MDGTGPARLQAWFRTAFSNAPFGLAIATAGGRLVAVNAALATMASQPSEALLRGLLADVLETGSLDLKRVLAGDLPRDSGTCRLHMPDGNVRWVQVTVAGDGLQPPSLIYHLEDVTERERLQRQLADLVDHDSLTGLFSRHRFEQELDLALARHARAGAGGAVVMIDLDGFKAINDQFGHAIGDDLLRAVASGLAQRCRASDVLAHLSGDEFALLAPGASQLDAERVAGALVAVVAGHPITVGEERAGVSASVGVAMIDEHAGPELLSLADAAMYTAKEQGGNRFVVFNPAAPGANAPSRLAEAGRLQRAVRGGGFVLHCQPIACLADERDTRYELLIRMPGDSDGELIGPDVFLYAAERFGLIAEIDAWVISRATELIATEAEKGRRIVLAVNLAGRSLGPGLSAHLDRALAETGIDPACLIFELKETSVIANLDAARTFADRLHSHGCALTIDAFGAGLVSFSYLRSLRCDYVKVDANLVQGIGTRRIDQLLISSMVAVVRGTGIETIATFVTSEATRDLLSASGVYYAQGFFIAPPGPVDEMLRRSAA